MADPSVRARDIVPAPEDPDAAAMVEVCRWASAPGRCVIARLGGTLIDIGSDISDGTAEWVVTHSWLAAAEWCRNH